MFGLFTGGGLVLFVFFACGDVLHIMCCVFVCFSLSCVTCVASFSGLSIFVY